MDPGSIIEAIMLAAVCAGACFLSWHSLKNWKGDRYLCDDCRFNDPASCLKEERPKALTCTAYESKSAAAEP
jgi:hypothetical protein